MKIQHIVFMAALSVMSAVATPVLANGRPLEPEDALMKDAEVYAGDFGVDVDTAMYRLGIQTEIGDLDTILQLSEMDDFAGLYIQNEPVYHIYVLYKHHKYKGGNKGKKGHKTFNGRLNARLAKTKWRNFVKLRKVKFTLVELEAIQNTAVDIANTVGIPADTSIDIINNNVELAVTDVDAFNDALTYEGLTLPDSINLIEVSALASIESIYGGLPLSTNIGGCTVGFGVRNSSGTRGIVTAAHCGNTVSFDGTNLPFQSEVYSGATDMQWHTAPGLTVENDVRTSSVFGVTTTWRNIYGTVSRSSQSVGSTVCKYGNTTGYGCGTIMSTSHRAANVPGATSTYVRVSKNGLTITAGGDSGGPWFSGNNAYGVHHAGAPTYSVYTPINYISNLGISVLTN